MADNKPELQRGLEARHIELIALGGTIGVGLFMGAASTLKWAGPSVLLAYIIAGLFVFFIMRSMGEMLFLEPVTGSFAVYAHRYMSPFFGYLTAWSYWFMWMAVGISEITAIGVYVQFWFPEMAQWIPALIAEALNPRGERYTPATIRERLTMRDFMDTLRASGIQTGGPDSLSQRDRQAFAAELEKWWLEVQRSRG